MSDDGSEAWSIVSPDQSDNDMSMSDIEGFASVLSKPTKRKRTQISQPDTMNAVNPEAITQSIRLTKQNHDFQKFAYNMALRNKNPPSPSIKVGDMSISDITKAALKNNDEELLTAYKLTLRPATSRGAPRYIDGQTVEFIPSNKLTEAALKNNEEELAAAHEEALMPATTKMEIPGGTTRRVMNRDYFESNFQPGLSPGIEEAKKKVQNIVYQNLSRQGLVGSETPLTFVPDMMLRRKTIVKKVPRNCAESPTVNRNSLETQPTKAANRASRGSMVTKGIDEIKQDSQKMPPPPSRSRNSKANTPYTKLKWKLPYGRSESQKSSPVDPLTGLSLPLGYNRQPSGLYLNTIEGVELGPGDSLLSKEKYMAGMPLKVDGIHSNQILLETTPGPTPMIQAHPLDVLTFQNEQNMFNHCYPDTTLQYLAGNQGRAHSIWSNATEALPYSTKIPPAQPFASRGLHIAQQAVPQDNANMRGLAETGTHNGPSLNVSGGPGQGSSACWSPTPTTHMAMGQYLNPGEAMILDEGADGDNANKKAAKTKPGKAWY
ncbi:uncharacterized protein RAG0_09496 [Rhynchosporium agropyri]|uniref:Uncharacterized protein n=1 Tax=Rhynchosporium agropyri TaxID=914238 RepID=A0A1E1KVR9_9HELO|nr:uncharacterized protein RAG0_09496 [Rhynchosporium agropyri]